MTHFANDVIAASHQRPVLVDFHATWCGPCRMLGPALHKIAQTGLVSLVTIDTDQESQLAAQHQVSGIPDVRLWHHGREIGRFVGFQPVNRIVAWIEDRVAAAA
jgi:putative thioredoxin